ncbi:hypothetical protein [uncultured Paracoccus sp.]|uniref:hypothetical protein n=1 Tax=uncultured Paracoccus sp. TaxID=189685 RepID=UPI002624009F|nr:hypothetical protein [uncultured Paracoccus sp.]
MNLRFALLAVPLALGACDEAAMADFRMPWDKPEPVVVEPAEPAKPTIPAPPQVSPVEQPLELGGSATPRATAQAETVNLTAVAAAGEGWSVDIADGTARFARPGANTAQVRVNRLVYVGGVEFVGELNGRVFALTVSGADCGPLPLTATLRANGNRYQGCAQPAAAAPASTTSAPSAAAPARTPA